jgi:hypothetical protein
VKRLIVDYEQLDLSSRFITNVESLQVKIYSNGSFYREQIVMTIVGNLMSDVKRVIFIVIDDYNNYLTEYERYR